MTTLVGNKHLSIRFFSHGLRLFHLPPNYEPNLSEKDIKVLISAPTE